MRQGYSKIGVAIAAAIIASYPLRAEGQGLPQSPDAIYFTLADHAAVEGPVYEPASGSAAATAYANGVARETLVQADRLGAFWLEEENPEAYLSFMTGALVVPMHESSLQHYRRLARESGRCAESLNSGTLAQTAGAKAERIFGSVMKTGATPIVPACSAFNASDPALQLLGSYDGLSTGLMQINFVAHPDYLPHGDFLSVRKTVARGLEQYFGGFKKIVENPSRYPCVQGAAAGDIDFTGVVRGAWAGAYNSGNVGQTCRFTALSRPDSTAREQKWARENDVSFKRAFDGVLNLRNGLYATALSGDLAALHRDVIGAFDAVNRGADLASLSAQAHAVRAVIARLGGATAPSKPTPTPVTPASTPTTRPAAPSQPAGVANAVSVVRSFFPVSTGRSPIAEATVDVKPGGSLNVRLRPSTESRIVDVRKRGARVQVYSRFNAKNDPVGWLAISPNLDRWVYARYVTVGPVRR